MQALNPKLPFSRPSDIGSMARFGKAGYCDFKDVATQIKGIFAPKILHFTPPPPPPPPPPHPPQPPPHPPDNARRST
ncbi:MAG: hypothetical protein LBQ76_05935, partial [Candidatus Fibromonas sp.]|nr:hypothetical protein [Candidatus Fibromonas sp.]